MPTPPARRQRIVITGVTRGLGRALAAEFAGRGHTVLGCGRSARVAGQKPEASNGSCDFYRVNVASDDEVKSWASLVLTRYGAPDMLINNAALMNHTAPLWDVPAREFDEVVDVNLKGVANVIRHFAPAMIRQKHGVIVNFSSGWGRSTDAEVAPYCATKWAVEGLTQALAQELPSGMAAVPLNPGIIDTDMLRLCWPTSAGHYPTADQWAGRAATFLLKLGPEHNGQPLSVP